MGVAEVLGEYEGLVQHEGGRVGGAVNEAPCSFTTCFSFALIKGHN